MLRVRYGDKEDAIGRIRARDQSLLRDENRHIMQRTAEEDVAQQGILYEA